MAETTWKQAVYDIADAYREAEGTTGKISIANLKEKVRDGGGKVYLDGERIKQLEMTSYKGDNPFTVGQEGMSFNANTLITEALQIINGVSGEDLTETASRQTTSVDILLREVKRKIADHKGEGEYVWKKSEYVSPISITFTRASSGSSPTLFTGTATGIDLTSITSDDLVGMTGTLSSNGSAVEFVSNSTMTIGAGSGISTYSYTYEPSTQTLSIPTKFSGSTIFTIDLYVEEVKTFLTYVISSDPEAYPDGGELDGYWYERVSEGVDLLTATGLTKIAVDTFAFSKNTAMQSTQVVHSLGVEPSFAIILSTEYTPSDSAQLTSALISAKNTSHGVNGIKFCGIGSLGSGSNSEFEITSTYIMEISGGGRYTAGVEYTLITMA